MDNLLENKKQNINDSEDGEERKKRPVIKSATDLQRLKLEKLMKNPDKPVIIPETPKEKDYMQTVPSFVRNVMGSSAGAGSGEFHVYRHLRRKEYARQKCIQAKSMREQLDEEYQAKLEKNRLDAEAKTAKKRAKRLKKKQRAKKPKSGHKNNEKEDINEDTTEDEDEDEENESVKTENIETENIPQLQKPEANNTDGCIVDKDNSELIDKEHNHEQSEIEDDQVMGCKENPVESQEDKEGTDLDQLQTQNSVQIQDTSEPIPEENTENKEPSTEV